MKGLFLILLREKVKIMATKKRAPSYSEIRDDIIRVGKWASKSGAKAAAIRALEPVIGSRFGAILGATIIVDQLTHVKKVY